MNISEILDVNCKKKKIDFKYIFQNYKLAIEFLILNGYILFF